MQSQAGHGYGCGYGWLLGALVSWLQPPVSTVPPPALLTMGAFSFLPVISL